MFKLIGALVVYGFAAYGLTLAIKKQQELASGAGK